MLEPFQNMIFLVLNVNKELYIKYKKIKNDIKNSCKVKEVWYIIVHNFIIIQNLVPLGVTWNDHYYIIFFSEI